jgi:CRP/FNR family transcriptional regulator
MITTEAVRTKLPQFADEKLVQAIAENGREYKFEAGDLVIDHGMPIPFIPLITEGVLRIVRRDEEDHELLLYYLDAGQTCATSLTCCMSNVRSEIEAIAEEDVRLIGIPAKQADEWYDTFPEWKAFVMQTYKYRFDELLDTINNIAFTQLDQRLIKYLLNKGNVHNSKVIKTSHQEIAQDLNSSREVISRLLKKLERDGRVQLARSAIDISNLQLD